MARTPEEWSHLLGSTIAKMQASEAGDRTGGFSADCYRVMAETIACVIKEARTQGRNDALAGILEQPLGVTRHLHA